MNRIFSVRSGLVLMLVCGLMFVSGCQKVSGTYTGSDLTINFKSSSKADVTIMGQTQETDPDAGDGLYGEWESDYADSAGRRGASDGAYDCR
jgi:hypothetical protein